MLVPLADIQAAQRRLCDYLPVSPLVYAESFSRRLDAGVYFKLELLLATHAFKVRGALNAVLTLSEADKARGIVTASAGNHGLGISYAAGKAGVDATVVLPTSTPQIRLETIERLGATVISHGEDWNAAHARALELVEQKGLKYISPFNDDAIMAGQGTIALELLEQCPELDAVICSVGGGGLISGVASAIKQLRPEVKVYGVETLGADCMARSLEAGRIVELDSFSSIAQSLGTKRTTERQLAVVQEAVDELVVVSDEAALRELMNILNFEKLLVEPAASCTLAAFTEGLIDIKGQTVAAVICGGNIKLEHVLGWLERFELRP